MDSHPLPRRSGLTLIEILVAVAILAILGMLAAPSMRDMLARSRVQAITSELVSDIQFARSYIVANAGAQNTQLTFNTTNATLTCYTVHTGAVVGVCNCVAAVGAACLRSNGQAYTGLNELKTVQVRRDTSVAISSSFRVPSFSPPDAAVNPPEGFRINVSSSRNGALRILVGPTGRPSVCSPDGSIKGYPLCQ